MRLRKAICSKIILEVEDPEVFYATYEKKVYSLNFVQKKAVDSIIGFNGIYLNIVRINVSFYAIATQFNKLFLTLSASWLASSLCL